MTSPLMRFSGLVVANHGRHIMVETMDGKRLICHPKGKKNTAVVGDHVRCQVTTDEGRIESIDKRLNLFYRQDELRTKSFAANIDQILILIAADPEFSEAQLTRALIAAEAEQIKPVIALNKSDLTLPFARAWERLEPYRKMGYTVVPLALKPKIGISESIPSNDQLQSLLEGKITLVLGPSGSGKSTLINLLIPGSNAQTGEISQALNSGKHTTTSTTWYWLDRPAGSALIDSPGFQEFGLHHLDAMHLANLMPDLKMLIKNCKFYNCTHLHEPGCGILSVINTGKNPLEISPTRYSIYSDLFAELTATRY